MTFISEIGPEELLASLPPILPFTPGDVSQDALFICACGFEPRCVTMASGLAKSGYKAAKVVVFEYETNASDNALSRGQLTHDLSVVCASPLVTITYREQDFVADFGQTLDELLPPSEPPPRVTFDVSACSAEIILSTMRLFLERKVSLRILYTEAAVYHPTLEEYQNHPEEWTSDSGAGMSSGILTVKECPAYPGFNQDQLPTLLIAFPTFKPERIRAVVSELQPSKTMWALGIPHLEANCWRVDAMRAINAVPVGDAVLELPTFDYAQTFAKLEQVYREHEFQNHVVICPLGSKLQNLGIALFCSLREDVPLWFSTPQSFNPGQYTDLVGPLWEIDFGAVDALVERVRSCGRLEVMEQ